MNFQNAKLLSYGHANNFWGQNEFKYGSTISISIKGYILDLANTSGVKDIFLTCKHLSDSVEKQQTIIIDNVDYGDGIIEKVSFDSGNWVKVTEYTVDIKLLKMGNLLDINYSKEIGSDIINGIKGSAHYIESFNESYSVDYQSSDNKINGTHSIDLKMSSLFPDDKIKFCKNLANFLFSSTSSNQLCEVDYLNKTFSGKRKDIYSENYNLIDGACGFKRTFSYTNDDKLDCYSNNRSISIDLLEDGVVNVEENNKIKGECLTPTAFDSAELALQKEIAQSFNNCKGLFNKYKLNWGITRDLNNLELKRSIKRNRFIGEIEYSVAFSNSKKNNERYIYQHSLDLSRSEGSVVWNVSENGSINGTGILGDSLKFDNALFGWNQEKNAIIPRIQDFYTTNTPSTGHLPLKFINKNLTVERFNGLLSYSYLFTDDKSIETSGDIRKKIIEITNDQPTRIHNDFIIPGGVIAYTQAQVLNQSKQGELTIKGTLDVANSGYGSASIFDGRKYFQECVDIANSNKGAYGQDMYMQSFSFSSDEIEQNITFDAKYKYSESSFVDEPIAMP